MKIRVKGWITPEAYNGTVLKDETPSRALQVDLEIELDAEGVAIDGLSIEPVGHGSSCGSPAYTVRPILRAVQHSFEGLFEKIRRAGDDGETECKA